MRELTSHKVNGVNDGLTVGALGGPGPGGAHHHYVIEYFGVAVDKDGPSDGWKQRLSFQNGPIAEAGVNGVTNEALLAILIDRLEGFQSGKYACVENQEALESLRKAQDALKQRTRQRVARGVEGTTTV